MGLIISVILKTVVGIIGAGYFIELVKKILSEYKDGKPIKKIAPIVFAATVSLYIVIWLNHDYIYAIYNGIFNVSKSLVCELINCRSKEYADNHPEVDSPLVPQEPQPKPPTPAKIDRPTPPTTPQVPVALPVPQKASETSDSPSFDCSNIHSSVESAICGDPGLSHLDRLTAEAYKQLESNPSTSNSAFNVKMDLVRGRAACIKWTPGEPYKSCIRQQQLTALRAYRDLGASIILE